MSNPEFTAPDYTSQTAATYKANIDASIAANGNKSVNLACSYASGTGTFTIHDAQGSVLSAANPGFVKFQDQTTAGHFKYISVEANQDFIDDVGSSEIIGNLFGFTTGVAVSSTRFYIYAVANDDEDAVAFMLSRQSNRTTSPAAAKIGAPDDAVADSIDSFFALDSLDETLYDSNPCVCIGSIEMAMSTSDDWTVQTLDASHGIDVNSDRLNSTLVVDDSTSQMTKPLQSAFSVSPTASQSNVTGDGTDYTIAWAGTEIFDRNNDFSGTTFTAPVTGLYQFNVNVLFSGLDGSHTTGVLQLVTSNRTYEQRYNPEAIDQGGNVTMSMSILADMDASDTCTIVIDIQGGTKTIDINGNQQFTNFQGYLVA